VLPLLEAGSVDAVVTDSPYGINTKSDGNGKLNPWADLCNSAFWYAEWFRSCRRALSVAGSMWTCLNWRSLVTFQKASCDCGWPIESLLVWDKQWIGPGGSRGLRPSYELVALFVRPEFSVDNRGLPDVQRFAWSGFKPNGHPAEKPEALMMFCVENGSAADSLILDPFTGSGTTGVACIRTDRRFIGIELDPSYYRIACDRIRREWETYQGGPMFAPKQDEPALF
jgi:site-specific DNA-methyltransferase (adenine-specific)